MVFDILENKNHATIRALMHDDNKVYTFLNKPETKSHILF